MRKLRRPSNDAASENVKESIVDFGWFWIIGPYAVVALLVIWVVRKDDREDGDE